MIYRGCLWKISTYGNGKSFLEAAVRCGLDGTDTSHPFRCRSELCGWADGKCDEIVFKAQLTVPYLTFLSLCHSYWREAVIEAIAKHGRPYDNVPWPVHQIEDEIAWKTACETYKTESSTEGSSGTSDKTS